MQVHIKRVYDKPAPTDGLRVLVDRLWPRGLTKKDAAINVWAKDLAPSSELRTWFDHRDERFEEFTRRYRLELDSAKAEIDELMNVASGGAVTLLYAAKNKTSNHAIVLQKLLQRHLNNVGIAQHRERR